MNLSHVKTLEELKLEKSKFFGKDGEITKLQKAIRTAEPSEKSKIGKQITELKTKAEKAFAEKMKEIELNAIAEKVNSEWVDVTEPLEQSGSLHPLTLVANRARHWLNQNGYF